VAHPKHPPEHFVIDMPHGDVSFDPEAFDRLIRSQGVKLVHYRAQRCPVGLADLGDIRRPHPHHEGCSNGFIYTKVGVIVAFINSNSKTKRLEDVGFTDTSSIQVSFPRTYEECVVPEAPFVVAPFDRFYLKEESIMVPMWQLFLHSETGVDRLKYEAEQVEGDIIDARGERFKVETDFQVCKGQIEWVGKRPAPIIDGGPGLTSSGYGTDRGAVCSIRYLYRPYWYVGAIPHEIRVAQIQVGATREIQRMPQLAVLHREYVSLNIEQDPDGPKVDANALRQMLAPMYGGFGPK
jgi:hypothetical protein